MLVKDGLDDELAEMNESGMARDARKIARQSMRIVQDGPHSHRFLCLVESQPYELPKMEFKNKREQNEWMETHPRELLNRIYATPRKKNRFTMAEFNALAEKERQQ